MQAYLNEASFINRCRRDSIKLPTKVPCKLLLYKLRRLPYMINNNEKCLKGALHLVHKINMYTEPVKCRSKTMVITTILYGPGTYGEMSLQFCFIYQALWSMQLGLNSYLRYLILAPRKAFNDQITSHSYWWNLTQTCTCSYCTSKMYIMYSI